MWRVGRGSRSGGGGRSRRGGGGGSGSGGGGDGMQRGQLRVKTWRTWNRSSSLGFDWVQWSD